MKNNKRIFNQRLRKNHCKRNAIKSERISLKVYGIASELRLKIVSQTERSHNCRPENSLMSSVFYGRDKGFNVFLE